jgi:hypothetical protein
MDVDLSIKDWYPLLDLDPMDVDSSSDDTQVDPPPYGVIESSCRDELHAPPTGVDSVGLFTLINDF